MDLDVFANRRFQFSDVVEHAAPDSFVGEFSEPALHQIQPRTICRGEVDVEAGPFEQPFVDKGGLVCAIVILDQMYVQTGGNLVSRFRNS